METVLQHLRDMVYPKENTQGRALMTTKTARQYVTVEAIVEANAKLVGRAHGLVVRVEPHSSSSGRPPPSKTALAQAGARALQLVKTS